MHDQDTVKALTALEMLRNTAERLNTWRRDYAGIDRMPWGEAAEPLHVIQEAALAALAALEREQAARDERDAKIREWLTLALQGETKQTIFRRVHEARNELDALLDGGRADA